jgi:hypothetical protein
MVRKKILIWLLPICLSIGCDIDQEEGGTVRAYDIVLIAGQSNTHYGLPFDPKKDTGHPRVKQLGRFNGQDMEIIDAVEPLDHHTRQYNRNGFGLTFAKLMVEYLEDDRQILLIPCGYGGSGFIGNRWNKGDDLYEDVIFRVNSILEDHAESRLVAILWHQGETDVSNGSHQKDLDDFIKDMRNDLGADTVPFILGGMVPYWVNKTSTRQLHQEIIATAVERHVNVGYADPEQPFLIDKPDDRQL